MCLKKDYVRVDINIPVELKERLKEYGYKTGYNLTSTIVTLVNKALASVEE